MKLNKMYTNTFCAKFKAHGVFLRREQSEKKLAA